MFGSIGLKIEDHWLTYLASVVITVSSQFPYTLSPFIMNLNGHRKQTG